MKRLFSFLVVLTMLLSLSAVVYGEPAATNGPNDAITEKVEVVEDVKEDAKAEETEVDKEEVKEEEVKEDASADGITKEENDKLTEEVKSEESEKEENVEVVTEDETVVEEEEERGVMSHDPMPAEDTPITEAPKVEFVHPSELDGYEAVSLYNSLSGPERMEVYPILKVSIVLDYIFFFAFLAYILFYIVHFLVVLFSKKKSLRANMSLRGFLLFVVLVVLFILQMNNMYITDLTEFLIKYRLMF